MSDPAIANFPTQGMTHAESWPDWEQATLTAYSRWTKKSTDGLLGHALTPAQWMAEGNLQAFQPFEAADGKKFTEQEHGLKSATAATFAALDLAAKEIALGNDINERKLTLLNIMTRLRDRYGHASPEELTHAEAKLRETFNPATPMELHLARQKRLHRFLASNNQPISQAQQVRFLIESVKPLNFYDFEIRAFNHEYPTADRQTFSCLSKKLLEANIGAHATTQALGYAAATTTTTEILPPAQLAQIVALVQAAMAKAQHHNNPPRKYCWTHGSGTHSSTECKKSAPGHNNSATHRNKLGGKRRVGSVDVLVNSVNNTNTESSKHNMSRTTSPTIIDSGANGHYIATPPHNTTTQPINTVAPTITLPDGTHLTATHKCLLDLPQLPDQARTAYIFPSLQFSLISVGTLCDHGCTATFTKDIVHIQHNGTTILKGFRNQQTRLWHTRTDPPTPHHGIATLTIQTENNAELVQFYHATLGSPPITTMLRACKAGFLPFPLLTPNMIQKNPPHSVATAQGHLDLVKQGIQSTQPSPTFDHQLDQLSPPDPAATPTPEPIHAIYTKIIPATLTRQECHIDLTGQFPLPSIHGNNYCLVMIDIDSNFIHIELMPSRRASDYTRAVIAGHNFFTAKGQQPQFYKMDNETSEQLLQTMRDKLHLTIQHAPPNNHRTNKAERAIRTFKNHFIATLCTADPSFPLEAWDELIPQAELTLNLLRASRTNPNQSPGSISTARTTTASTHWRQQAQPS